MSDGREVSASFLKKRSKKLLSAADLVKDCSQVLTGKGFLVLLLLFFIPIVTYAAPRSGYDDSGPQVRAMQDDDTQNPAFLWVLQAESLWTTRAGTANTSCADCHGAPAALKGIAAQYPAWNPAAAAPITLAQRINLCRTTHQGAPDFPPESDPLLALTTIVALQSRGQPLDIDETGPLKPFIQAGQTLFNTRQGQLNLSCANCHEDRAGHRLGGALIPEGHANGYPQYRLEWQKLGSFPRRLRACMLGVRAEPLPPNAPDATNIELYLATRARGLKVETPAVRP